MRQLRGDAAASELAQRSAELLEGEQQVLAEVAKAYAELAAAGRNLTLSQSAMASARLGLAALSRRYERGAADLYDLTSARNVYAGAQLDVLRSQSEWWTARLTLFASAGELDQVALRRERASGA